MSPSTLRITFCTLLAVALCGACTSPEVTSTSFTTQDATIVASIAYIGEFRIKCAGSQPGNLYAEVDGNVQPVAVVGDGVYQVSWTEDTKTARSGGRTVRVFTEDGYAAYRKAARAGDDVAAIESLADVIVHHPGAFYGPWLKSEFLAVFTSVVVAYIAIASKSKLSA